MARTTTSSTGRATGLPRTLRASAGRPPATSSASVVAHERRYMRHGMADVGSAPPALSGGRGSTVWDVEGNKYLDLFAGAGRCVLGHGDLGFGRALASEGGGLVASRHPGPGRAAYAESLVHSAPDGLTHLSMFSTGSEAVDAAVRMARSYTGRSAVIVFSGAFHGRTSGVAAFTDDRWLPAPAPPDHNVIRCPFPGTASADTAPFIGAEESLDVVRSCAATVAGGVAAVLVEPAQGTAGNRTAPAGFLAELSRWCRATGTLLMADEILTGFGRTGAMFAVAAAHAPVDVLVLGKGMANGFPVGAVLARPEVAAAPPTGLAGALSSTYGGNPLAVAASSYTLEQVHALDLPARAQALGTQWREAVTAGLAGLPWITEVTGSGLMVGIRLGEGFAARASGSIEATMRAHGLLVGVSGDVIRLNPPLTVTEQELASTTAAIGDALSALGDRVDREGGRG